MSPYKVEVDPYLYPGRQVLRNKAGLTIQADLDQFEQLMLLSRAEEPLPRGRFSTSHLCAVHRHLFGDVYDWAGRIRTVRLSKGNSSFCYPENIRRELAELFVDLHGRERLARLDPDRFANEAAAFLARLNAIHPFREGNGRTQLAFFGQLAMQAGHPLALTRLDGAAYFQATIRSFFGDERPLASLLRALIR